MVWGMLTPKTFGQFWPDGRVEMDEHTFQDGWDERLTKYYKEQAPEEQKRLFDYDDGKGNAALRYGSFPGKKFRNELGTIEEPGYPPISPIEPHEPPRSYTTRPHKKLGSFIALSAAPMAVDEDLKEIIERLEPGIHEFFPIKFIIGQNEQLYHRKYYTIRVGQYLDSFIPEAGGTFPEGWDEYCFLKQTFGAAHLWRERKMPSLTFFSDELMAEITIKGLLLPKHYKMKEV